jgi:hypothetical protein
MRILRASLSLLWLALARPALAQTFPADSGWVAFPCGGGPMVDAVHDQSGALGERDLVGDRNFPAGFHAIDSQFLYLRLRVDADPTMGANLRPGAWGFAFGTDTLPSTYQVLITLDGATRVVGLYRNSVTTVPDSPTDPADPTPLATYPVATHGRTAMASGSNFGGNRDHFIDMAVPWSALASAGMQADTAVVVWAASSTSPDRLNGDFACHDAMGSGGVPSLSGAPSDRTTSSTTTQPSGTGTGGAGGSSGGGAGGVSLEGGPGCAMGGPPHPAAILSIAVILCAALGGRGRRRGSHGRS